MPSTPADVTGLLAALGGGDQDAMARLLPVVYDELHAIAQRAMRGERRDHTLQATALVHEAYLKLVDQTRAQWQHRSQFFAVAAQAMRRILIDHARARRTAKRGGGPGGGGSARASIALESAEIAVEADGPDLLALDEALTRLSGIDAQQARVVELRFFGGLTVEETADLLGVSPMTVKREWATAKTWLRREMTKG